MSEPSVKEAVTVALLHGGDLLLIERPIHLSSFPGFHVFPGGKVDRGDHQGAPPPAPFAAHPATLMRALVRELREELGLDLDRLAHLVESVQAIGRAITPTGLPYRFDTRFFALRLRERPELRADAGEVASLLWAPTAHWRQRYEAGELLLAPPTRRALTRIDALALEPIPDEAHPDWDLAGHGNELAIVECLYGLGVMAVRSNTLPPAQHTNCFLIGEPGQRLLVDPSPCDEDEYGRLLARLRPLGIAEILLTHHHPDHREYADRLARTLGVALSMSAECARNLGEKAPGFLDGVALRLRQEGDEVARWMGQPVRVLEVPGHDAGHLALMPDNRAWCIVGDLIQGIGTVVIARPEGNMRQYFASLQRIIDLAPRVIYPSHGAASASCLRLSQTLGHRQLREQQVLDLHQRGLDPQGMLDALYADVAPLLRPLALMNVEGHLDKLRQEGRIAA